MKQINDLIVLSVPKDSRNHQILDIGVAKYCQWDIGLATGVDKLPPGQYEIIGLYSEVGLKEALRIGDILNFTVYATIRAVESVKNFLLKQYQLKPTDTTDLLFIHKIK